MRDPKARLRLILIATVSQGGLRQQDRRRLMGAAELSRKQIRTLNSLEILGLSIFASTEKNRLVSMLAGYVKNIFKVRGRAFFFVLLQLFVYIEGVCHLAVPPMTNPNMLPVATSHH
jgi:hypothetical protein